MGKAIDEDNLSMADAYINFQIQVKRREIEEFKESIGHLEATRQKHLELRDQLKEEQKGHSRVLRKQAKDQERKLEQSIETNKQQVEEAVGSRLQLCRDKETELSELSQHLVNLEENILTLQAERSIWLNYKNIGQHKDGDRINHLQDELTGLQKGFEEMAENIYRSLEVTFSEIDKNKVQLMDEKKLLATARAVKLLDKDTHTEIKQNEWLKKEVAVYQKMVSISEAAVQNLEEENLSLTEQHLSQRLKDLQIPRSIFLTQAAGLGPVNSVLLDKICKKEELEGKLEAYTPPGDTQAVVDDGRPVEVCGGGAHSSCNPKVLLKEGPHDLGEHLYSCQTRLKEAMHLGPLGKKLLTVVGLPMPVHTDSSEALSSSCDNWPVTVGIIRNRFSAE